MLQVTEAAVFVLRQVVERPEVPGNAVRIQPVQTPQGEASISFQPVTDAQPGDDKGEAQGLDVFVAPELSAPLDSVVLDARQTEGGPELFVRPQSQEG